MATNPGTPQADEVINAVEKVLVEMALYDIHRALGKAPPRKPLKRTTKLTDGVHPAPAAFLLGCCLVEAAGHFMIGPPPPGHHDSQHAFEVFADKYLKPKGYDPVTLYKAMRCGLAHAYTTTSNRFNFKNTYKLVQSHWTHHLQENRNDPLIRYVNLQDFICDIENGLEQLFQHVRANANNEQERFLAWAEDSGWLAGNITPPPGSAMATIITSAATPPARPPSALADPTWTSAAHGAAAPWNWGGVAPPIITQVQLDLTEPHLIKELNSGGAKSFIAFCEAASGTGNPQTQGINITTYAPTATLHDEVRIPPGLLLPKGFGRSTVPIKGTKSQRKMQTAKLITRRIKT
ncbi:MAG: hypothetical protein K2Y32_07410 [Candidatus Obscuribacterales bacterium]|nr:hypothetical protein [Candidatus Obscuribacterales bacterium]